MNINMQRCYIIFPLLLVSSMILFSSCSSKHYKILSKNSIPDSLEQEFAITPDKFEEIRIAYKGIAYEEIPQDGKTRIEYLVNDHGYVYSREYPLGIDDFEEDKLLLLEGSIDWGTGFRFLIFPFHYIVVLNRDNFFIEELYKINNQYIQSVVFWHGDIYFKTRYGSIGKINNRYQPVGVPLKRPNLRPPLWMYKQAKDNQ